ncbi:hypothetical protein [Pseudokordiimonas caeni]|uniref:hypothetical protein n=1 Tax=Pseudokordiimonas caeni TaxID=2997908 RepID=UPI0028126313|nr:hypothetical protein [Pseudokordiimonas caeni]
MPFLLIGIAVAIVAGFVGFWLGRGLPTYNPNEWGTAADWAIALLTALIGIAAITIPSQLESQRKKRETEAEVLIEHKHFAGALARILAGTFAHQALEKLDMVSDFEAVYFRKARDEFEQWAEKQADHFLAMTIKGHPIFYREDWDGIVALAKAFYQVEAIVEFEFRTRCGYKTGPERVLDLNTIDPGRLAIFRSVLATTRELQHWAINAAEGAHNATRLSSLLTEMNSDSAHSNLKALNDTEYLVAKRVRNATTDSQDTAPILASKTAQSPSEPSGSP